MADSEAVMKDETCSTMSGSTQQPVKSESSSVSKQETEYKPFTLKKWNIVAMWSWDVECDTCAICRVQVMGKIWEYIWEGKVSVWRHHFFIRYEII